jgi:hypothetical protein
MARRKNNYYWELGLGAGLVALGVYLYYTKGTAEFMDILITSTFITLFAGLILRKWIKRGRK